MNHHVKLSVLVYQWAVRKNNTIAPSQNVSCSIFLFGEKTSWTCSHAHTLLCEFHLISFLLSIFFFLSKFSSPSSSFFFFFFFFFILSFIFSFFLFDKFFFFFFFLRFLFAPYLLGFLYFFLTNFALLTKIKYTNTRLLYVLLRKWQDSFAQISCK